MRTTLIQLLHDFERWRELTTRLPPRAVAETVLEESGYVRMWQEDRAPDAPGRLENLKELVHALEEFESLAGFLEHVGLVMDNADDPAGDMVTLMTLHGAKGLEFDTVFLPGWEEGVFPNQRAIDEGGAKALEEERRLAYVGMTRARAPADRLLRRQSPDLQSMGGEHAGALHRRAAGRAHRVPDAPVGARAADERLVRRSASAGGRGPGFQRMRAAGKAPLIEGQARVLRSELPQQRASARGRPADLPREVRLRPGAGGRGQQARDRFRQGRHQEGDRQLCRPGLTAWPSPALAEPLPDPGGGGDLFLDALETDAISVARVRGARRRRPRRPLWRIELLQSGSPTAWRSPPGSRRSPNGQALRRIDLTVAPVAATDWLARTAESFPAQPIGRFWIHGSHITATPPAGTMPIQLDAGPAFGSGEHASTQGCLLALDRLARRRRLRRVLDLGCGSGILAIAAAKLGAAAGARRRQRSGRGRGGARQRDQEWRRAPDPLR